MHKLNAKPLIDLRDAVDVILNTKNIDHVIIIFEENKQKKLMAVERKQWDGISLDTMNVLLANVPWWLAVTAKASSQGGVNVHLNCQQGDNASQQWNALEWYFKRGGVHRNPVVISGCAYHEIDDKEIPDDKPPKPLPPNENEG